MVCVKQVLDPESDLKIDASGTWIATGPDPRYQMNHFDEFVVEEAVSLKEAGLADRVDVLTLGPDRVRPVIDRALGMGADYGIHIRNRGESFFDPLQVAGLVAAWAEKGDYDLILTGVMSEDGMQGQVGPMTAELLGRPWATAIVFIRVSEDGKTVRAVREVEGGRRIELEIDLPAVLTLQSGINRPRYPALSKLLKARSQPPESIEASSLTGPDPRQNLVEMTFPEKKRDKRVLTGTTLEKADTLCRILEEKGFIFGSEGSESQK